MKRTHTGTKNTQLVVAALLAPLAFTGTALAQGRDQYTEIAGTGRTLYRIAVAPVLDGGGAATPAKVTTAVLTRDLTLSAMFKVLSPKGFLANLRKEGTSIDVQDWVNVGAQGVIKARAERAGSGYTIAFYLYDIAKGNKPVVTKKYRGSTKSTRLVAHRFGDEVVRYFTGERGVFTTRIAFAAGSRRRSYVYAMDFDGHGVHRVSNTGSQSVLPAWSPGGTLVWTAFLWHNPDLYVRKGSRAYRLSKRPGLNTGAAWSPDGSKIALTLSKDGNAEIYLISPNGKIIKRLTHNPGIDTSPTWSPDGSQIAFVSNRAGSPQIYVMSASGGGARRVTFRGEYNQEPRWCPRKDTPLIAYTARDKGGFDIFTINVKTGALKRLTQGQGSNHGPSWAPNGRLISFASSRGGIWIMDTDGLNQQRVYKGSGATTAWSARR